MEFLAQRYENKMIIDNELYNYSGSYKTIVENYYSMIYKVIANINNFLYYIDANRDVIKTPDYYEVMKGELWGYADSCILNCCAYSDRYIHKVRKQNVWHTVPVWMQKPPRYCLHLNSLIW